jgi:PQQ-dependent catabolism-associated CXXCW motif protein
MAAKSTVIGWPVRSALIALGLTFPGLAFGQAFDEARDYGIAPSAQLRLEDHASPTPTAIPGARLIGTDELRGLLNAPPEWRPLLFDVLGDSGHQSIPGAIALPGAGRGSSFDDQVQQRLRQMLDLATRGERGRQLVFFCSGPGCWLSYNAALRAARLGYGDVRWYRGGLEAWRASGGALAQLRVRWREP